MRLESYTLYNDCSDHTGYSGYFAPSLEDATYNLGRAASAFSSSRVCNAHLTLSACYWSWWRSLPAIAAPSAVKPYVKARKFLHLTAQWVNVPRAAGGCSLINNFKHLLNSRSRYGN